MGQFLHAAVSRYPFLYIQKSDVETTISYLVLIGIQNRALIIHKLLHVVQLKLKLLDLALKTQEDF